jgi:DNA-binding PucR family transcriptional regulator
MADSFRLAGRVLDAAIAFGIAGACRIEDVGLLPAVVADTELSDMLVQRRLAPLLTVQRFGESLIQTLRAYLSNGTRIETTAQQLVLHPNTLRHRLRRIEELTGSDLTNTEQLFEIWWALRALEARDSRQPER